MTNPTAHDAPLMKMILDMITRDDDAFDDFLTAMIETDDLDSIFTPAAIETILLSFDCCPIHRTDLDSCADDELTECARFRAAPTA